MVFQVCASALGVAESIDQSRRDYGVLHCLVDFSPQVLSNMQVIANVQGGIN
jgi:hypothetical protein